MTTEQIIAVLIGLILAAYAFIFKSITDRIKDLENLNCDPMSCERRFVRIEVQQDKLEPTLNKIQETLSRVEALLNILMDDYNNRRK